MRKADYAALACLIATHLRAARLRNQPDAVQSLTALAQSFAASASVDRAAFLKACGIDT